MVDAIILKLKLDAGISTKDFVYTIFGVNYFSLWMLPLSVSSLLILSCLMGFFIAYLESNEAQQDTYTHTTKFKAQLVLLLKYIRIFNIYRKCKYLVG